MARDTVTDENGDGHFGYGELLNPDTVDALITQHNEHAAALDAVELVTARILSGSGSPEGVVTAGMGTLYLNTAGGASTTLYVKTSGVGNTGWTAK